MRRRDAVQQLALTERQTQRLMNRFRESGAAGLTNLRRGRPGNHRLPESLKLRVLSLLHDHYSDFGPTLAAENLEQHGKPLAFYSDKHGIFRVNVHSNIRCSTNWNVSTKGKSLITNVLGLF
ncbi:TPA: helix-turn-helix domain-containing protein [Salmonella enterica]